MENQSAACLQAIKHLHIVQESPCSGAAACMLYELLTVDSLKHCSQGMLGSKTLSMVLGYRRR
jgi:hypothetical protein